LACIFFTRLKRNGLESYKMKSSLKIATVRMTTLTVTAILALGTLAGCTPKNEPGKIGEIKVFPKIPGADHTKTQDEVVKYDILPPVGGRHAGVWQNCGIYDNEIRNETAVHALEHGAIWFTYKPSIPETDKIKLRQIVASNKYTLMSPFPSQDANIIVTAWAVQLKLNEMDDAKIQTMLDKYMFDPSKPSGKDPQNPSEFGAQCAAGTGQPRQ
jgi:Protein of unknown function (DUF3105)